MTIRASDTNHFLKKRQLATISMVSVLLLTGCTGVSEPQVVKGHGEVWSISVAEPRFAGDERCDSDPMISLALMSGDMPSSGYSVALVTDAAEEDAQRIADCLRDALTGGTITMSSPSSNEAEAP